MWKIILQIELGCHVGGLLPHQPECVWHQQIIWGWLLSITVLLNFLNSLHMVRIYNYHEGFYQHICLSRCGLEMLTRDILWLVSCFVKSFFFFFLAPFPIWVHILYPSFICQILTGTTGTLHCKVVLGSLVSGHVCCGFVTLIHSLRLEFGNAGNSAPSFKLWL